MSRCVVLLWAATLCAQQGALSNRHTSPADVAQGGKTFRSHCAPCHGVHGEGGRGPSLASGVFFHGNTDDALLQNISNGIAGTEMPGLFYSSDRVWQVVAYIRSLNAGSHPPQQAGAAEGAALFQSQGCSGCHRIHGTGGGIGPDLSTIGMSRSLDHLKRSLLEPDAEVSPRYWVVAATDSDGRQYEGFLMNEDTYTIQFLDSSQHLRSLEKASLRSLQINKASKMPSYRGRLSEAQVNQLVAYLSSLRPTGGVE